MQFRDDDRAQSIQVGAILLFGILIITLATFQATVVPDQNAGIEFDHSQTVQSDMQDLRNGVLRAADGDASPTRVSLGTTYSNRLLFINPPPPTGELRTVGDDDPAVNVTIGNESGSVTVDSEYENAREYWATAPDAGVYNTSEIVYTPDYAEYDGAPTTVYENSVLFNTFDNGANRTLSGQRVVQGNTINLLALRGDLEATGIGSHTTDVTTVSEQARTVTVESNPDDPLSINVTSRLSAAVWNETLLGGNADARDAGTVTNDDVTYHRIQIELDPGTYKLRGAAVGIGALSDDERETVTEPAYMVVTEGYQPVANGSNGTLTVEVRDQFNNPVTNATVNASADGEYLQLINDSGAQVNETSVTTDAEGQATIAYHSEETTSSGGELNVSIGTESYEKTTFDGLTVPEFSTDDGDGGELNPGTTGDLIQTGATLDGNNEVDVTFENTLDASVNITGVRLNFYFYPGSGGGGTDDPPTQANEMRSGAEVKATNISISGDYHLFGDDPVQVANDSETTLTFAFDGNPKQEDFFVVSLVFEFDDQTYRETYFVGYQ